MMYIICFVDRIAYHTESRVTEPFSSVMSSPKLSVYFIFLDIFLFFSDYLLFLIQSTVSIESFCVITARRGSDWRCRYPPASTLPCWNIAYQQRRRNG